MKLIVAVLHDEQGGNLTLPILILATEGAVAGPESVGPFSLTALAWPIAAIVIVLLLRRDLPAAVERVAPNVKSIAFAGFEIELRELRSISVSKVPALVDVENSSFTSSDIASSDASNAIALAAAGEEIGYGVIDLGDATVNNWLTSRIVLVAALIRRYRKARYCVFLQNSPIVRARFVGIASCADIELSYPEVMVNSRFQLVAVYDRRSTVSKLARRTILSTPASDSPVHTSTLAD